MVQKAEPRDTKNGAWNTQQIWSIEIITIAGCYFVLFTLVVLQCGNQGLRIARSKGSNWLGVTCLKKEAEPFFDTPGFNVLLYMLDDGLGPREEDCMYMTIQLFESTNTKAVWMEVKKNNFILWQLWYKWQSLIGKGKVNAVPWSGPEGSRNLRFPDFTTRAQDGGKVSLVHRPTLPPGNAPGAHFC